MILYCPVIRLFQRDGISPSESGVRFDRADFKDEWVARKVLVGDFTWPEDCCCNE